MAMLPTSQEWIKEKVYHRVAHSYFIENSLIGGILPILLCHEIGEVEILTERFPEPYEVDAMEQVPQSLMISTPWWDKSILFLSLWQLPVRVTIPQGRYFWKGTWIQMTPAEQKEYWQELPWSDAQPGATFPGAPAHLEVTPQHLTKDTVSNN